MDFLSSLAQAGTKLSKSDWFPATNEEAAFILMAALYVLHPKMSAGIIFTTTAISTATAAPTQNTAETLFGTKYLAWCRYFGPFLFVTDIDPLVRQSDNPRKAFPTWHKRYTTFKALISKY